MSPDPHRPSGAPRPEAHALPTRWRRWLPVAGVLACAALGLLIWVSTAQGRAQLDEWARWRGHHRYDHSTDFLTALLGAPFRLLGGGDAPYIEVEIGRKDWRDLCAMRLAALQKGLIEEAEQGKVDAVLRTGSSSHPVRLRLKGDHIDHLEGDKWSFRIEMDGSDQFLGMRRFSLQDPRTRGFQGEPIYQATLRLLGVMVPRYHFVHARVAGRDYGVMAVEEHVAKELQERHGRREAPVIHFDEAMVFHGRDDYREATASAFGEGRLQRDPVATAQVDAAIDLLRSFVDGFLPAQDVFAVDQLGAFLATATFWGSWHSQRWHNLRLSFDPVRQRLEPIGYEGNLHMRRPLDAVVCREEDLVRRLLADPAVFAAFEGALRRLCDAVEDGTLPRAITEVEARALPVLQSEAFLLEPFPQQELLQRAAFFRPLLAQPGLLRPDGDQGPLALGAWAMSDGGRTEVTLLSRDGPATVERLSWVTRDGRDRSWPLRLDGDRQLPVRVPAGEPVSLRGHTHPAPELSVLELAGRAQDRAIGQRVPNNPRPSGRRAVPSSSVAAQIERHPFLRWDPAGRTLWAEPGRHVVRSHLVVPPETRLELAAGTELAFAAGAALVAHGPVHVRGTADAPVVFTAADEGGSWLGVAVLEAGAESRWEHAIVRHTAGVSIGAWTLTGAVTFARSPCVLLHCRFEHNAAEDAVNAVATHVDVQDCTFADTKSDAFDGDLVTGTLQRCVFERVEGDGVDVSRADIDLVNITCSVTRDKAISIGEGSVARLRGLRARSVGTGVAVKDGSRLVLRDADIEDAAVAGVMVYCKKPEFGPAFAEVAEVRVRSDEPPFRAQLGSELTVDGRAIPAEAIDVDQLYRTVMRKY